MARVITCDGGLCEGTNRPDTITGSDLRDRVFALDGADDVLARAGSDVLHGGNDIDTLCGENGKDTYFGEKGPDALSEFCGEVTPLRAMTRCTAARHGLHRRQCTNYLKPLAVRWHCHQ